MTDALKAPEAPKEKPAEVKIISIAPVLMPNNMRGISLITYGLGDDSMLYAWDGKTKVWVQQ